MGLTFPTGHTKTGTHKTGQPLRPANRQLCHCGPRALVDEDGSCVRCGRYTKQTVDRTWAERAAYVASRGRARKATA